MMKRALLLVAMIVTVLQTSFVAQRSPDDEYARYELLAPETASFRVVLELTIASAGMTHYTEVVRKGAEVSDVSAIDLATGASLIVKQAPDRLAVYFSRPVAQGTETRIRLQATYKDAGVYSRDGDSVVFSKTDFVPRNAIVLPKDYELVAANVPVQVLEETDGRIAASFMIQPPAGVMEPFPADPRVFIRARLISPRTTAAASTPSPAPPPPATGAPPRAQSMDRIRVTERARQDREIVYFLKEPETHAFSLYHDYTASREGEDNYINIVRTGSRVSDPSAKLLDTGEELKTQTLRGAAITAAKVDIGEPVTPETEIVVIPFGPVKKGQSLRLRISETYTDPARYALVDGQLMWHRSFGRPRNDMVLPAAWYLTTSSIPATITREADGRIRLSFWNPRPDNVEVFVKARRR